MAFGHSRRDFAYLLESSFHALLCGHVQQLLKTRTAHDVIMKQMEHLPATCSCFRVAVLKAGHCCGKQPRLQRCCSCKRGHYMCPGSSCDDFDSTLCRV